MLTSNPYLKDSKTYWTLLDGVSRMLTLAIVFSHNDF
jgi:hypothetical protein